MASDHRRRPDGSRGQAVTELALVVPLVLLVMLGLIELGRAVYYTQILDSAARDGARYAIVHGFESFCPSGPMPFGGTNTCDPNGNHVVQTVLDRSIGVTAKAADLTTHVKWCDATLYQTDPPQSACGDYDLASRQPIACSDWSGPGDGDNDRGQIVTVCVQYAYQPILAGLLPIPDFTVSGRASLVVNH